MNQKNLWIALITLIVAIFGFAQVYILFAVTQIGNQIVQLEKRMDQRFTENDKRLDRIDKRIADMEARFDKRFTELEARFDKRFNLIETRLEALNQNYIKHLAYHIEK